MFGGTRGEPGVTSSTGEHRMAIKGQRKSLWSSVVRWDSLELTLPFWLCFLKVSIKGNQTQRNLRKTEGWQGAERI